jgi:hypothetical protein
MNGWAPGAGGPPWHMVVRLQHCSCCRQMGNGMSIYTPRQNYQILPHTFQAGAPGWRRYGPTCSSAISWLTRCISSKRTRNMLVTFSSWAEALIGGAVVWCTSDDADAKAGPRWSYSTDPGLTPDAGVGSSSPMYIAIASHYQQMEA